MAARKPSSSKGDPRATKSVRGRPKKRYPLNDPGLAPEPLKAITVRVDEFAYHDLKKKHAASDEKISFGEFVGRMALLGSVGPSYKLYGELQPIGYESPLLDPAEWVDLAGRVAALEKARHQDAKAVSEFVSTFGDSIGQAVLAAMEAFDQRMGRLEAEVRQLSNGGNQAASLDNAAKELAKAAKVFGTSFSDKPANDFWEDG